MKFAGKADFANHANHLDPGFAILVSRSWFLDPGFAILALLGGRGGASQ
jgi:hypothetical protein